MFRPPCGLEAALLTPLPVGVDLEAVQRAQTLRRQTMGRSYRAPHAHDSIDRGGRTMNPVVHFEMPYDDRKRMAIFYESAFDWRTQMLGEDMGNYVLATTTETNARRPQKPGAINGGFFPRKPDWPAQYPSIVVAVDDIRRPSGECWMRAARFWASRSKSRAWGNTSRSRTPRATA